MLSYQSRYIENAMEILRLEDPHTLPAGDFEPWYREFSRRQARMAELRRENNRLLSQELFPTLDELYSAGPETLAGLEEFAARLMDWTTNLDIGVYVLIHDSLLSMYRVKKDRAGVIRELYKLGMGLYYLNRTVDGIDEPRVADYFFRNEMVFTEGGSYLKFFPEIEDAETKGYIVRSLANIAICTKDLKRRVSTSARILLIVQDEYYRSLAPELPWDQFLKKTHQQMSSNRGILSKGNLSAQELAAVLDSCYEVFKPEDQAKDPNIRWLWPYYEMEYSCGFVDLNTTLERLERIIEKSPWDQFDMSGLYGNVQLSLYYGILMDKNPSLQQKARNVHFLAWAYQRMMKILLSLPVEKVNDYSHYLVRMLITSYLEIPGVAPYREVVLPLMQRMAGPIYLRGLRAGAMLRLFCDTIIRDQPDFFDDIEFLRAIRDPAEKREALLRYAEECGLFYDFGLIKMNLTRTMQTRELLENEYRMYSLHTVSGRDDLRKRSSTAIYADVAFGHHAWYNGSGGYPEDYVRNASPYRQMTDVAAVVDALLDRGGADLDSAVADILRQERSRYSPLVTVYLGDRGLRAGLAAILADDRPYARKFYEQLQLGGEQK